MDSIVFFGLNFYAWITILTMLGIFVVMARTHIPAELAFSGAITILLVFGIVSEEEGIVSEEEGLEGFGSEPVIVHAAFFVVMAGLMQSGFLYWLTKHLLGVPKNL